MLLIRLSLSLTFLTLSLIVNLEVLLILMFIRIGLLWIGVLKNWRHIIIVLMLIEMGILLIFFLLSYRGAGIRSICIIFLFATLIAVEARLGMANLTLVSRSHGNDFMLIF